MRPSDLIRADLGEDVWAELRQVIADPDNLAPEEELSPFHSSKTYVVDGRTGQFEFPALPDGSYCLYCVGGQKAVRLTRTGKEIETVLQKNWCTLGDCDPVILARLILTFFDSDIPSPRRGLLRLIDKFFEGGVRLSHQVLCGENDLRAHEDDYVLNDPELERVRGLIGRTSTRRIDDGLVIRAVTLFGWMHEKRNLGIEHIRISKSGEVQLERREVLSREIFSSVPDVFY